VDSRRGEYRIYVMFPVYLSCCKRSRLNFFTLFTGRNSSKGSERARCKELEIAVARSTESNRSAVLTSLAKGIETRTCQGPMDSRGGQEGHGARQTVRSQKVVLDCFQPSWSHWKAVSRTMAQPLESRHLQGGVEVGRRSSDSRGAYDKG
jgi:hypothetical protein